MSEGEYRRALLAKLVEEAQEVAEVDNDEQMKEIAEQYEVINALLICLD